MKTKKQDLSLKNRILANELTLGSWIQMGIPASAEILAGQGFDWIAVDCEHGLIDLKDTAALLCAIESNGAAGFVRLPACDDTWIRRVLDAGAQGIIVPMVNSPEIARKAVTWAKYPPQGKRGFGFSRASQYGARFEDYVAKANRKTIVIAQIEHIDAVKVIDDILSIEGIDGTLIGPYDLSGSMGLVGQTSHPDVLEQCDIVLAACKKHHKTAGIHVVSSNPELALSFIKKGYRFVALGIDTLFLRTGASAMLKAARS